jgi:hypothetical protein
LVKSSDAARITTSINASCRNSRVMRHLAKRTAPSANG